MMLPLHSCGQTFLFQMFGFWTRQVNKNISFFIFFLTYVKTWCQITNALTIIDDSRLVYTCFYMYLYHSATGIGREGCEALFYSVKCDGKLRKPRLRLKCQEPKQNVRENSLGWSRLLNEKQAVVKPPHHNCKTNQPIHTHRTHVLVITKVRNRLKMFPANGL